MNIKIFFVIGFLCFSCIICEENAIDSVGGMPTLRVDNGTLIKVRRRREHTSVFCTTANGEDGLCVKKAHCDKTIEEIDPALLFVYRRRDCHFMETCCPPYQVKTAYTNVPKVSENTACGYSNTGGLLRFKDTGTNAFANFAEFPWVVALLRISKDTKAWTNKIYFGVGTLIHPSVVMTAAHKVETYHHRQIKCRAGEWDTQSQKEHLVHQERYVKKIIKHNEIAGFLLYDIALLILAKPFQLRPHIGVACLGKALPPPGTLCYSMGWGVNLKNSYAAVMKKIPLAVVGKQQCENNLKNTELGSTYTLHDSLMCAGGESGVDTCFGDGGAPLVCAIESENKKNIRYAVFGMVAFGAGCGHRGIPGVYVNIPYLYHWVGEQMALEDLPITGYRY